ncbi:MAG: aminoacyl-tRNA hydrolase [Gammaproteobacteria bacterium]
MPSLLRVVVGLGNPGPRYSETRHNAGFWFLDRLAADHGVQFRRQPRLQADTAHVRGSGLDCRLLKPATFMNDSGRAVRAFVDYYGVEPGEILIVYDEIDLEPGTARLKRGGGDGGHNGLSDVIACLGGADFLRLRIGVGHPGHKDAVVAYVLSRPTPDELTRIDDAVNRARGVMPLLYAGQIQKAMTQLHSGNMRQATGGQEDQ